MRMRGLSADDIFISYSRMDGATYALGLADALTKDGFSCFLDRLGTDPGKDLTNSLRRKIRGCSMFVVIGTERAGTRQAIEDEIKEFLGTRRRLSIVPIDFNGAVVKARWYCLIEGIALEPEKNEDALTHGQPSLSVISRIEKQFSYTRRDQRLRRVTAGTAALLVLLIMVSLAAGVYAKRQVELAREASERAERARAEVSEAKLDAERARDEALAARDEAGRAKSSAAEQEQRAVRAAKEALKQTRLAAVASSRALEATATVRQQEGIAAGRQAATIADIRRAQSVRREKDWVGPLESSTLLSIEAARRLSRLGIPTAESDQSLRASLDLLPRSVRAFDREVEDVLLSADGKYFVTKEADFVRVWNTASFMQISDGIRLNGSEATFNHDRSLLALVGKDKRVSIWELPAGKHCWDVGRVDDFSPADADEIPAVRFSPDGRYIAASVATQNIGSNIESSHQVVIWDAKAGVRVTGVTYEGRLHGIALSPGNDLLALSVDTPTQPGEAVGKNNSIIQLWVVKNPATLLFETKNSNNDGPLHALSFSPNGKLLAVAGDNRASILEVGGGKEFTPIEGVRDFNRDDSPYIYKLSFSPDGKSVGAMRKGIDADTWDVLLGRKLWGGYYNNERWSYEKPYVVILEPGGLRVLDVTTGSDVARLLRGDLPAYGADYAPAANILVVNFEKRVLFYDISSAQEVAGTTLRGGGKITSRSPDQRYLVLKDDSRSILWDALDTSKSVQIEQGGGIDAPTFSPDETLLAFLSDDDSMRVIETSTGRKVLGVEGVPHLKTSVHGSRAQSDMKLGFSPRSGFLVLETLDRDTSVRIFSLSSRREVINLRLGARFTDAREETFSFTLDEKFVLLRDKNTDRVFNTASGALVATLPRVKGASMLVLAADNTHMGRSLQETVEVSEIASGRVVYKVKLAGGVSDFAFSPDGKLLAAVGGQGGYVWNAATGRRVGPLSLDKEVNYIQFSPDGKFLVLFHREIDRHPPGLLGLLNIASGRSIVVPGCGGKVIFSPEGRRAVVPGEYDASVCLLDLAAGHVVARLAHDGAVLDNVTFSGDGSLLATASEDRVAHVWDTESGLEVARLPHENSIISVVFVSEGKRLATVSDDRTARVWILKEDELIKLACERLNQKLTSEEGEQNLNREKYEEVCPKAQISPESTRTASP